MLVRHIPPMLLAILSGLVLAAPKDITCYSDAFPPYVTNEGGKVGGIDVDTIAEISKRVGVSVHVKLLPWVRLEEEIKKGASSDIECAFAYGRTPAREAYMDFMSVPLHVTAYTLFMRNDAKSGYKSLTDMKGKTIALRRGFKAPPAFEEEVKKGDFRVNEVDKDEQALQMLANGRVDAVLTNQDVGSYMAKQLNLNGVGAVDSPVSTTPTFLIFTKAKGLAATAADFDKALKAIQQDGSYKKFVSKYW